jgi:microcystin-dependent protein
MTPNDVDLDHADLSARAGSGATLLRPDGDVEFVLALQPYPIGPSRGLENVALTVGQIPLCALVVAATGRQGTAVSAGGGGLAAGGSLRLISGAAGQMGAPEATGGSQPHPDTAPSLNLSWAAICLQGIYPSRG